MRYLYGCSNPGIAFGINPLKKIRDAIYSTRTTKGLTLNPLDANTRIDF